MLLLVGTAREVAWIALSVTAAGFSLTPVVSTIGAGMGKSFEVITESAVVTRGNIAGSVLEAKGNMPVLSIAVSTVETKGKIAESVVEAKGNIPVLSTVGLSTRFNPAVGSSASEGKLTVMSEGKLTDMERGEWGLVWSAEVRLAKDRPFAELSSISDAMFI